MLRNGKRFRCEENEHGSANQRGPERNPLLNHVVLTRFFEFCKLSDLLDYRLVSKEWYSASLPRIRNEATVIISNAREEEGYIDDALSWTELHYDFKVVGKPFQSFKLCDVDFFDSPPPSQFYPFWSIHYHLPEHIEQMYKNMQQFWGQWGEFIHKLTLINSGVYSAAAFKKVIFEDLPNLEKLTLQSVELKHGHGVPQTRGREDEVVTVNSNLKHLNLNVIGSSYIDRELGSNGQFPISWSVLFDHFPNVETLKHRVDPGNAIASLVTKLEPQDEILLKVLKMSVITQEQSESVLRLVQLPKLKLRRLCLSFREYDEEDDEDEENIENVESIILQALQTALRFQGDHLESLYVNANGVILEYDESELMNNFPFRREPLQNLSYLEFSGTCPNFHFLQQTPNLKYLRLFGEQDIKILDEVDMEILGTTKLPLLSEFYFDRGCISEKEMQIFVEMMPNVERFHALIDSGAFRVVCGNWLNLRDLEVADFCDHRLPLVLDYVGDEAITGIVKGCEERLPNITHLLCLRKLKIMSRGRIGDASIWNGFLKLPELSTIEVSLSPKTSGEAYAALVTRFPDGNFNCSLKGHHYCSCDRCELD